MITHNNNLWKKLISNLKMTSKHISNKFNHCKLKIKESKHKTLSLKLNSTILKKLLNMKKQKIVSSCNKSTKRHKKWKPTQINNLYQSFCLYKPTLLVRSLLWNNSSLKKWFWNMKNSSQKHHLNKRKNQHL